MKQLITPLILLSFAIASLFLGSSYYYLSPLYASISHATAVVHPTKGNHISGIVHFTQQTDGLHIVANIQGLTPGEHGFHIHEFGDCGCDDAVCAGGHFNPTHTKHGAPNKPNAHLGDLGNITADKHGNAHYDAINKHAKLNGPHSIIGRAVIIHEKQDDLHSQPTGNAGARLGCGVIGITNK